MSASYSKISRVWKANDEDGRIVAPVGLHGHWNDHLTRLTGGTIKVEIYNRTGKHSSGLSKSTAHIIVSFVEFTSPGERNSDHLPSDHKPRDARERSQAFQRKSRRH